MKKIFLLTVSLLFAFTTIYAERVSQEDAALVANHFMSATVQTGVKKASGSKMVLKKAASAEENQYYVYENASGEGWVMVAANDIAHPILAYSPTGQFRTDNQPKNLKVWLGGYDRQIKRAAADGVEASESIKQEWAALRKSPVVKTATPVVSPLIKTGWDQDEPFWNLCPTKSGSQCYTGCVATAMAQVMNYWQWPVKGTGSHTDKYNTSCFADFGNTTYDWANMANLYSGTTTSAQKTAVATLMYHCGIAVDMQYGTADEGGSGAYTIDYDGYWSYYGIMCAETALKQFFGYNSETVKGYCRDGESSMGMRSWTKAEWIAMLKAELDAKRPIMYAGVGCDDPNDDDTCYGHSFVCDGYDTDNKFHFNFGWTNWCDGYYDVDALDTTDPGSGGGNGSYNLQQDVIVGIMPPGQDRNVTWMANGSLFTQTVASKGILTLPTSTPSACSNGKVFVGWTATANYESATTAPTFVAEGALLEADATYYAVFATQESGSTPSQVASVTFKTNTSDGSTALSDISKQVSSSSGILSYSGEKVYQGKSGVKLGTGSATGSLTLTLTSSVTVTKVVVNAVKYGSDTGKLKVSAGSTSLGEKSPATGLEYTASTPVATNTIKVETTSKRAYVSSITVTAGGGATYKDYSTSCGAVEPCVLTGITLNTDNVKKTFNVGEAFSSAGLVVTAAYGNCSNKTVTPASVSTPDMTSAGTKTVTVSYTENAVTKTATYNITVNAVPVTKYTVRWHSCAGVAEEQYEEGAALKFPANPGANGSKTFKGWITTEHYTGATAPSYISAGGAVNANADYYAVYGD